MTDDIPTWKPDDIAHTDIGFDAPDVDWADMDPTDLDRLFDILDAAVGEDARLNPAARDSLLSVLEATLFAPTSLDDEEVEELFSVLEEAVVDPANPDHAEEVLTILEAGIAEADDPSAVDADGLLSVIEASLVDPTSPDTAIEEVAATLDSLGAELTNTDTDVVESTTETFLSLADVTGFGTANGDVDEVARDVESLFDSLGLGVSVAGSPDADEISSFLDAIDTELDPDGRADVANEEFRVARIVAAATQRSTEYSVKSGIRTGTSMARVVLTAESLTELVDESRTVAFDELERLGFEVDREEDGETEAVAESVDDAAAEEPVTPADLQAYSTRLLEASADVEYEESAVHPAFPRVLSSLCPDEVRILRLLATEGPQPAIDIKDVGFVPITSKTVAAGVSMLGADAGCRYESRVQAYLNNLQRLGLVWFSDEPLDDLKTYQILEAQPAVTEVVADARRAKITRRSIHLTPFGVDFCRVCLPIDVEAERPARAYEVPPEDPDASEDVDRPWADDGDSDEVLEPGDTDADALTSADRNGHHPDGKPESNLVEGRDTADGSLSEAGDTAESATESESE